jgi:hypothetical protein
MKNKIVTHDRVATYCHGYLNPNFIPFYYHKAINLNILLNNYLNAICLTKNIDYKDKILFHKWDPWANKQVLLITHENTRWAPNPNTTSFVFDSDDPHEVYY